MNFKSDIPIYIQIATDIKEHIMSGYFKEGDKLPSVRAMSDKYEVTVLTIQRATSALEQEGIIYSQKGVGSFVTEGCMRGLESKMIQEQAEEFVATMLKMGLSNEEIIKLVANIIKAKED